MKRRWRRWGKWMGTVTAASIIPVWIVSGWYVSGVTYASGSHARALFVGQGAVSVGSTSVTQRTFPELLFWPPERVPGPDRTLLMWAPQFTNVPGVFMASLPLWVPFLLISALTAFLWYRDRRHPPGCCPRCGYDLTGVSGVCPECGPKP